MLRLDPTYFRLIVDWAKMTGADGKLDLALPRDGCARSIGPCAAWAGIQQQLQAVKAAQAGSPGHFRLMAVISEIPDDQAVAPSGCEPKGILPRSRAPKDIAAYQDLIRQVNAEADRVGVKIEFWSPLNEPNHPYFLSPQRTRCAPDAPSASVPVYVSLARAMQQTLEPGQKLVLGELGGTSHHPIISTSATDFVSQLPEDLVCGADVISVHGYAPQPDPVPALEQALPCDKPIWVTETGAKSPPETPDEVCRTMEARLEEYYADPHIMAVFQYPFRNDPVFPTGLVSPELTSAYPALDLWTKWSAGGTPPSGVCL